MQHHMNVPHRLGRQALADERGVEPVEVVGRELLDLYPPDRRRDMDRMLTRYMFSVLGRSEIARSGIHR